MKKHFGFRYSLGQITITSILLVCVLFIFDHWTIDIWVQNQLYSFEAHRWGLDKNNIALKIIFYTGIKIAFFIFTFAVLMILLIRFKRRHSIWYYKPLCVVFFSIVLVPLIVSGIKVTTNMPCPKHLTLYGGAESPKSLFRFSNSTENRSRSGCFPAGHASGGFALLSLVFLFRTNFRRALVIVAVLTLGWSIGFYKMYIGDHFLSHTLVSMLLSWLIILIVAGLFRITLAGDSVSHD